MKKLLSTIGQKARTGWNILLGRQLTQRQIRRSLQGTQRVKKIHGPEGYVEVSKLLEREDSEPNSGIMKGRLQLFVPKAGGPTVVQRSKIRHYTPDGRLVSQTTYSPATGKVIKLIGKRRQ